MRIKLSATNGSQYMSVQDFNIGGYTHNYRNDNSIQFWFFSAIQFFSYSGYPYKFKTQADVEKVIEDIYAKEAAGNVVIYDLDYRLSLLGIELVEA